MNGEKLTAKYFFSSHCKYYAIFDIVNIIHSDQGKQFEEVKNLDSSKIFGAAFLFM